MGGGEQKRCVGRSLWLGHVGTLETLSDSGMTGCGSVRRNQRMDDFSRREMLQVIEVRCGLSVVMRSVDRS
jgi:hypothetical protein